MGKIEEKKLTKVENNSFKKSNNTNLSKNNIDNKNKIKPRNQIINISKLETNSKKGIKEQRDTSGDTKIFKAITKEDIEKEKRIQAIKKENENKTTNNSIVKLPNKIEKEHNNYKEPKKEKNSILITLLIIIIILLMLVIFSTIFGVINLNSNKIINGIFINNIEISNLTKEEAKNKLEKELNNSENNYITLKYGEFERNIYLNDIAGEYIISNSVDEAYELGRNNNIIINNYKTIEAMIFKFNMTTAFNYNEELVKNKINEIAIEMPGIAIDSSYIINDNKLIIKNGKAGLQIKNEELSQKIVEAFSGGNKTIDIPVETAERKEIDIEKIYKEIYKEPKNAYYTTNPRQVYKEEDGLDFAISLEQAKQILQEDKEEYEIPLKTIKPKVTINNLDTGAYPDLLGTFTTTYGTGDANRNTNIALAARSINSVVVMPGETFSYNTLIGECSARTGYKAATIYLNGALSTGIGGGICQVSTTLYNAVIRANLEIVERRNHSLGVTYVPAGHDAMVSIGTSDFKFKNNRNYPVKVVAYTGTGSITCQIYGLKNANEYEVKLQSQTIEKTDTRYKVQTYKVLYQNGKEISRTLISTDTYKYH